MLGSSHPFSLAWQLTPFFGFLGALSYLAALPSNRLASPKPLRSWVGPASCLHISSIMPSALSSSSRNPVRKMRNSKGPATHATMSPSLPGGVGFTFQSVVGLLKELLRLAEGRVSGELQFKAQAD